MVPRRWCRTPRAIADGKEDASTEGAIRQQLLARRERFVRLAETTDLVARAAQWVCRILEANPRVDLGSGGVYEIGDAVESELAAAKASEEYDEEAEQAAILREDPSPLLNSLETMRVGGRMEESNARKLIRKTMDVGLWDAALSACDRLSYDTAQRDELRVVILLESGARGAARESAIDLARDWLKPPSSPTSVNQVLPKKSLIDLLSRVALPNDAELTRLLVGVEEYQPPIYMGDGDVF